MNRSKLLNVLMVSVGLSLLQPLSAFAGTITITDLTDTATISLSSDISGRTGATASCIGEVCTAFDPFPAGAGTAGALSFAHHDLLEPVILTISDTLSLVEHFDTQAGAFTGWDLTFTSDSEAGLVGVSFPGTNIVETGDPQQIGYMDFATSSDSAANIVDFVIAQSDINDSPPTGVPEPISLILFGTGLIGMGALRRFSARPAHQSLGRVPEPIF